MIKKGRKSWLKGEFDFSGSVFTMLRVFDGKNAWTGQRGIITDKPALNYQSDLDHTPLLLEKDAAFSFGENTEIEGKSVIGIEVTFNNKKTTFFIDRTDHTLKEIRYSDLFLGDSLDKETLGKRIRCLDYKKIRKYGKIRGQAKIGRKPGKFGGGLVVADKAEKKGGKAFMVSRFFPEA